MSKKVPVRSHTRNGRYVKPHWRKINSLGAVYVDKYGNYRRYPSPRTGEVAYYNKQGKFTSAYRSIPTKRLPKALQ